MRHARPAALSLVLLVALVVAACGGSSGEAGVETSTTRLTLLPTTTTTVPPPTTVPPTTSTTTTTTSTTTTTTTTAVAVTAAPSGNPAVNELVLRSDGIGGAAFSAEPEGVIAYLSSFLGGATGDTGWVDPFSIGACSGTQLRLVSWGALELTFGDVSQVLQGQRHFYAYTYGIDGQPDAAPAGLKTDRGTAVGSRLVDLLAAYPNAELNPPDDFTPPSFFVNNNFRGYLSGLADDSVVTVLFGGQGCGE